MIALSAEGRANTVVATRVGVRPPLVRHRHRPVHRARLAGLDDAPRSGRPHTRDNEGASVLRTVRQTKPPAHATHWSVRSEAAKTGISNGSVQRDRAPCGVQPHRTTGHTLSTVPFVVAPVRDVVRRYLNPPDPPLVLSMDEKGQIRALGRTPPHLSLGIGHVEGITLCHTRRGTTRRFAALAVGTGDTWALCKRRHRHVECLAFLLQRDAGEPAALDVHLILDHDTTHTYARVRAWLARRPRYRVGVTPTLASWLDQVERCVGRVTRLATRRGTLRRVREPLQRIAAVVMGDHRTATPFVWRATADPTLARLTRLANAADGTAREADQGIRRLARAAPDGMGGLAPAGRVCSFWRAPARGPAASPLVR